MKPRKSNQPPTNQSRHNSDLTEEQKSERLSTRLSTKVSSFNLFGCCWKGVDTPSTVSITKKFVGRPTAFMGAQTTLTPHMGTSKQTNKDVSCLGSDRSYIEQESFVKGYPMDLVFILGGRDKIVAKITFVKVSKSISIMEAGRRDLKAMNGSVRDPPTRHGSGDNNDTRPRSQSGLISDKAVPKKMKKEIFSKFDKGIKAEEWLDITPEKVAKHVANRLKCDTIVDALCGFGGNAIQFAKTCNFVIGIDIQNTKTLWAKHNAKIYGIDHKIDFITGDFTKIRNLTGDIVFLGPAIDRSNTGKPFSLFENIKPDPLTLLAKSLQVSYKIAIQLPGDTQLEELPQIFHQSLDKYDQYSKRFCIEIEKVLNTFGETECLIVYFGDCSSINQREEYEAIYDYIGTQESPQWKREFPLPVVTAILEKVGIRRSFKYLSEAENQISINSPSLFGIFLHRLRQENIINQTTLNKIIEEEGRRHEWSGYSYSNVNGSYGSLRANLDLSQSQSLLPESLSRHPSKLTGLSESIEKPRGLLSRLVSDPNGGKGKSSLTEQITNSKTATLMKGLDDKLVFSPQSPSSMLENGTLKNSYEVSELAVSSYSVSSDYLKDSSEEDNFSRQFMGENDDISPRTSSVMAKDKVMNRDSVNTEGSRRKNRAISQWGKDSRQFEVDGKLRKDRKESENRSFLLQCGDEF